MTTDFHVAGGAGARCPSPLGSLAPGPFGTRKGIDNVQTFMPYPCFRRSVRALDNRRLGKQRVEAFQILRALRGLSKGWQRHPATLMWRGHEPALEQYLRECVLAWVERGFRNTMSIPDACHDIPMPAWMGDERVHASHRANLLRKDAAYYARHGWSEDPSIPYYWPSV